MRRLRSASAPLLDSDSESEREHAEDSARARGPFPQYVVVSVMMTMLVRVLVRSGLRMSFSVLEEAVPWRCVKPRAVPCDVGCKAKCDGDERSIQ